MEILNKEKGRNILIVGSGGTIRDYKDKILDHINTKKCITIGINYMTYLCQPDYHMWTNKQRYKDLGGCISTNSQIIIGGKISDKLIKKHFKGDYIRINHKKVNTIGFDDNFIYGRFRTCGVLAIMVANIMGAKTIEIVGMDGYTLYSRDELIHKNKNHHCYGSGYTDDANWEKCLQKDLMVDNELDELQKYGVDFKIITPTKFNRFYKNVW